MVPDDPSRVQVRNVMRTELWLLDPETSLSAAIDLLAREHLSSAPVVTRDGRPVGVAFAVDVASAGRRHSGRIGRDRHYRLERGIVRLCGEDLPAGLGHIQDVMQAAPPTVPPDMDLVSAARHLGEHRLGRVLVTEADRLVGLLTPRDALVALLASDP